MTAKTNDKNKLSRRETKAHLKTLVENSNVSRMRNAGRVMKYGVSSYTRNIWLSIAATLVMTITLVILMITVFASLILSATADTMRQKIDITVFFTPGTEPAVLEELATKMEAEDNVTHVEIADSETEYRNFIEDNSDNAELIAALQYESMYELMLNKMQATMRVKVADPNNLGGVRYRV